MADKLSPLVATHTFGGSNVRGGVTAWGYPITGDGSRTGGKVAICQSPGVRKKILGKAIRSLLLARPPCPHKHNDRFGHLVAAPAVQAAT